MWQTIPLKNITPHHIKKSNYSKKVLKNGPTEMYPKWTSPRYNNILDLANGARKIMDHTLFNLKVFFFLSKFPNSGSFSDNWSQGGKQEWLRVIFVSDKWLYLIAAIWKYRNEETDSQKWVLQL